MVWQIEDPTIQGEISNQLQNQGQWNVVDQPPTTQESLLQSLTAAPGRIGQDVLGLIQRGIKAAPSYYEKAKTEIPGLFTSVPFNPGSALKQGVAGLAELGHNTLNMPSDFATYLSDRLNLFPKNVAHAIPRQRDISQDINQLLGEPQKPGESLLRGAFRNANLIAAGENLLNPMRYTKSSMARDVARRGERLNTRSAQRYDAILNEATNNQLGSTTLPNVANQIDYQTIFTNEPRTARNALEEFQNNPNPTTAHFAKSDLLRMQRKLQTKYSKEGLNSGETAKLNAINEAIPLIEENMFIDNAGNISRQLANQYRRHQRNWRNNVRPYTYNEDIAKFRLGDMTAEDLVKALKNDELFKARGLRNHPHMTRSDQISKLLKKLGIGGGLLGGADFLYKRSKGKDESVY